MAGKRETRRRARLGRRIPRQDLARRREGVRFARALQRAQPEVIIELEVMFFALANEMRAWPDTWDIDAHGDMDGNNPHVWFTVPSLAVGPNDDGKCTCGLYLSLWKWKQIGMDVRTFTQGLIQRDVQ